MIFWTWAIFAALVLASDVALGRIFRMLWVKQREEWEQLGRPIATFWRPPELRSEFPNPFLSAPFRAGTKLAHRLLIGTPAPFPNDPAMAKSIWIYRVLVIAAGAIMIGWIVAAP